MKKLLKELPTAAPAALTSYGISPGDWQDLLRAAVESLRGTSAASVSEKRRFIEVVLNYGRTKTVFKAWNFEGTAGRQDYRVILRSGRTVGIEAKGCPDGNNMTIWDRPAWANEFVVWSLCPESLVNQPGKGVWSGVSIRLLPKMTADRVIVDAMIFWDGRCGSALRQCPKLFGVTGALRAEATDIPGQKADWLPPPCIYLFPQSAPAVRNPNPTSHTVSTCEFADAMLELFNVPKPDRPANVHTAEVHARGTKAGTEIRIEVISRAWPDGKERRVQGDWKLLRRD